MLIEGKFRFQSVKLNVVAEHWGQDARKFLGNIGVDFITRWNELSGYSYSAGYSAEMEAIVSGIIKRKAIQNQNLEYAST